MYLPRDGAGVQTHTHQASAPVLLPLWWRKGMDKGMANLVVGETLGLELSESSVLWIMYNIFGNFRYDLLSVSQLNEWRSGKKRLIV